MSGVASLDIGDHRERALLDELDEYYDAMLRRSARAEDLGPMSQFVREGQGWPFYPSGSGVGGSGGCR